MDTNHQLAIRTLLTDLCWKWSEL